ncbi:MAG: DUF4249 domain-containing protein [Taibaiella sp.]|nr:DUF4249 domain-containing protein [Taibaiella sp.]
MRHFKDNVSFGQYSGILLLILSCFFTSCEKEIQVTLASTPPQLVVQGSIENGQPPLVFLTTSIGFFSKVDISDIQNIFVHDAVITVSDGTRTTKLREYSIDTANGSRFSVYSVDTSNIANLLLGELGRQYSLTITTGGKTYTSVTTIPFPKALDTLWFGPPSFARPSTPKNALELFGNYTDPDTPGNYVRYFTKRNNDAFYPGGLFSDELVNGKKINNIDLFAGTNDTGSFRDDSLLYFYPGDSVTLKWSEIDKGVYNFWNTYQFALQSGGNPFSSPINVKTNITNGALGVWAGYGTVYSRLLVR